MQYLMKIICIFWILFFTSSLGIDECLGYDPYDPRYDDMFVTDKANNESSIALQKKEKSTWGPNFRS